MFHKNTLFILGAGASCPYGFPLGSKLIDLIISNMNDVIYLPHYDRCSDLRPNFNPSDQENNFLYDFNRVISILEDLEPNCSAINEKMIGKYDSNNLQIQINCSAKSYKLYPIKINEIKIFKDLADALTDFDPVSIDAFLRDNPSHEIAGKAMIIYTLLKCEDPKKMGITNAGKKDNWYPLLFNDLVSGCADKPESLLGNNIRFTTFNYDLSIDHYLRSRILKTEAFTKKLDTSHTIAEKFIETLPIIHIYGTTYSLSQMNYGQFSEHDPSPTDFNSSPHFNPTNLMNFKRFIFSSINYKNIKTMYYERTTSQTNKADIEWANEIIIIGFGFDRTNLNLLGFPEKIDELEKLIIDKTIRYFNYKGEMNALSKEFKALLEHSEMKSSAFVRATVPKPRFKLIESTASFIRLAYQNDFKIYLYTD